MSAARDLIVGVANVLNTAGTAVYDPARTWTSADTQAAVVLGAVPQVPDRVIVLNAYRLGGDDPQNPTGTLNVQAISRGAANDLAGAQALDAAVYDLLHGMKNQTFGTVHVTQALAKSSLTNGRDANNRWELSANYTVTVDLPATANRSY